MQRHYGTFPEPTLHSSTYSSAAFVFVNMTYCAISQRKKETTSLLRNFCCLPMNSIRLQRKNTLLSCLFFILKKECQNWEGARSVKTYSVSWTFKISKFPKSSTRYFTVNKALYVVKVCSVEPSTIPYCAGFHSASEKSAANDNIEIFIIFGGTNFRKSYYFYASVISWQAKRQPCCL